MDGSEVSVLPTPSENIRNASSIVTESENDAQTECLLEQSKHTNGLLENLSDQPIISSDTHMNTCQQEDSVPDLNSSCSNSSMMEVASQPPTSELEEKFDESVNDSVQSPSPSECMDPTTSGIENPDERSECASSLSNRDLDSSLSMASCNDTVRDVITPEYSVSRESSFAFLREESVVSTCSSNQDKEDFVSAPESLDSSSSAGSSKPDRASGIQPGELTNELVQGPLITLPSTQLPAVPPSISRTSSQTDSPVVGTTQSLESSSTLGSDEVPRCREDVQSLQSLAQFSYEKQSSKSTSADSDGTSTGGGSAVTSVPSGVSSVPATSAVSSVAPSDPRDAVAGQSAPAPSKPNARVKKTPNDFIFGKVIGEGSYSTVYLAKEVSSQKEFAIKVCDKKHLIRERKTHFVMREKEVLMKLDHSFFIKLAYTFQDSERLYYVLTYARNGELLGYLHKLSAFDVPCTRFYTAEIVLALEYLHSLGIVHRDLKPENILLSEDMHIKITDFGTSKILSADAQPEAKRKNSFVGTAEYVSPEVLNNQPANFGSDMWGLGCIIYQCLSGSLPFRSGNEYQTFQKIVKAEYDFPEGFHPDAKDLVQKLLVLEPTERLGATDMSELKKHPFYNGVDWTNLPQSTPPKLMPYLPATAHNPEFWGQDHRTGFDDQRLAEIITGQGAGTQSPELEEIVPAPAQIEQQARKEKLSKQRLENQFHQFVEDNLILFQGFVDKRKGLFARKRMLLLTEGPHLYYVDAHNKVLKGEIPWSKELRPEAKNFKIFFVHTPNRTYYLESRLPDAHLWVKKIQEEWKKHFGEDS